MNRILFKKVIKQLVLREMQMNTFGTPDMHSDEEAKKSLEKSTVKDAKIVGGRGTGKTVSDAPKQHIELHKQSEDCYDVVSVTNGSDRKVAKNLKLEEVGEFIKTHAKETEESYVDKAYNKSMKSAGRDVKKDEKSEEKRVKENEKQEDKMEEADEVTQIEVADDNTKKADEKVEKDVAPVDDDNSPQLGGELVDKIEKIIDRVLKSKNKAEPKTAFLKTDKDMESPDKLTVKTKDTPKLKEKK